MAAWVLVKDGEQVRAFPFRTQAGSDRALQTALNWLADETAIPVEAVTEATRGDGVLITEPGDEWSVTTDDEDAEGDADDGPALDLTESIADVKAQLRAFEADMVRTPREPDDAEGD